MFSLFAKSADDESSISLPMAMMTHLQKLWDVVDDREEDDRDNVEETVEDLPLVGFDEKEENLSNSKTYLNGSDGI